jgi:hypothetical protein
MPTRNRLVPSSCDTADVAGGVRPKRRRRSSAALAMPAASSWKTSGDAFGNCRRGLKIRPKWLDQILAGNKKIEIRNRKCPHLGRVLLVEVGSRKIKGAVRIVGSHELTEAERQEHEHALETLNYKKPWAWELDEVERFDEPIAVPPEVATFSVVWITRERWESFDRSRANAEPADTADASHDVKLG